MHDKNATYSLLPVVVLNLVNNIVQSPIVKMTDLPRIVCLFVYCWEASCQDHMATLSNLNEVGRMKVYHDIVP